MPLINKQLKKVFKKITFWLFTVLPGFRHVQKTIKQTIDNKDYDILLQKLLQHTVPEISVIQTKNLENILFLDARKQEEYLVSHLPNAKWVGYLEFDIDKMITINKQQPIVVYCSVGFRSEKIAEQLKANGYSNVYNLYGGIFEWVNKGQEVVSNNGATIRVHTFNKNWGKWLQNGEKVC